MLPKPRQHHAGSSYGARKPADVAVTLWSVEGILLGLYRENAFAIEGEAGDSLNIWAIPVETTILPSKHDTGP